MTFDVPRTLVYAEIKKRTPMTRKQSPPQPEPDNEQPSEPLSAAYHAFIDAYLRTFNATTAAKEAGYSERTAHVQGCRLLKNAKIKDALEARFKANAMSAAEILQHLSDIARGDIDDVVDTNGNLDLAKARLLGKTRLLRKLKSRTITSENSDIVDSEVELYGRLEALNLLGKYHALFTDRVEIHDWRTQAIEDIKAGTLTYAALVQAFDSDLATQLFTQAGVPIES